MTVLKVLDLLQAMNPERRQAVGDAIRGHVKTALNREVLDKIFEAVEAASKAGATDEEILGYVQAALKKRARAQRVTHLIEYRASSKSPGSSGKSG